MPTFLPTLRLARLAWWSALAVALACAVVLASAPWWTGAHDPVAAQVMAEIGAADPQPNEADAGELPATVRRQAADFPRAPSCSAACPPLARHGQPPPLRPPRTHA